ncbi:MAG: hypothetical protein NTV34_18005, partial [Proteobacteria bacterium]|nr:hypothetical protein [Pseudomonadota bacterium]
MDVTTRTILRHEWERRQKSSASYSLRAYARDLGFSVGFLSRVLSGQRLVSSKKIDDLSFRLKWSPTQREIFSLA